VLAAHAGELGLSPGQGARLEAAERDLAAVTQQARREIEEALGAVERPAARGRAAAPEEWHGGAGGREGSAAPPGGLGGGPGRAGGGMPGALGGGRAGGGGGHHGGQGARPSDGQAGPARHLASQLQRIEDAEMKAYLEAEAWLPSALTDRCRELVSRQREALLERHQAIRRRLGVRD
jgi:hypothetical protein